MESKLSTILTLQLHNSPRGGFKLRRRAPSVAILGILAAVVFARLVPAVELTETQGAAHAYPALLDTNGNKLGNGEFKQWIEDGQLRVEIDYEFDDDRHFEEKAAFRQKPELIQEKWSWKESKEGKISRQFAADFSTQKATAGGHENSEAKDWSENIEVEPGQTFAGFGFTLAIANLRKRLIAGEKVELKAVGFTPKPQVVTVAISHGGEDKMKMSGRQLKGDRFVVHPDIPLIAKLFVHVPDTHLVD